jgi:hypothetical protein
MFSGKLQTAAKRRLRGDFKQRRILSRFGSGMTALVSRLSAIFGDILGRSARQRQELSLLRRIEVCATSNAPSRFYTVSQTATVLKQSTAQVESSECLNCQLLLAVRQQA